MEELEPKSVLYSINQTLAERIQDRRRYLNRRMPKMYTQEGVVELLAEKGVRVSPTNYSHYETGRTTITAAHLKVFAEVLAVPVEWFYDKAEMDDFTQALMHMVNAVSHKLSDQSKDHLLKTVAFLSNIK